MTQGEGCVFSSNQRLMMSERRAGVATQSRCRNTWQFHFSLQRSGVRSRTPRRVVSRLAPRAVRDRPRDGIPRARRRRDRLCGEDAGPPPRFPRQRRSARRRSVGEHAHGFSRGRVVSDAPRMPGPPRASSLRRMRRVRRYRRGRARARRGTLRRRRRPGRRLRATTRRDRPGRAQILRRRRRRVDPRRRVPRGHRPRLRPLHRRANP